MCMCVKVTKPFFMVANKLTVRLMVTYRDNHIFTNKDSVNRNHPQ